MLPINSVELGIIAEGSWIGTPAILIKSQGCDVGCSFCNAKETWFKNIHMQVAPREVVNKKEKSTQTWAQVSVEDLVDLVREVQAPPYVVWISGGEPCENDLFKICRALLDVGYQVAVETSGVHDFRLPQPVWVTVAPKFGQPGHRTVKSEALQKADEVRMVVTHPDDVKDFELAMEWINPDVQEVYLQPRFGDQGAFELCAAICIQKNWKLSCQLPEVLAR